MWINPESPMLFSQAIKLDDGSEVWSIMDFEPMQNRTDDISYVVNKGDDIELVAKRFYGTDRLAWVIAIKNNMYLLPVEFYTGRVVKIPSPDYILNTYLKKGFR